MPRQTVYDATKRYQELGTSKNRSKSKRPVTATSLENINKICCRIRRNPEQSMRQIGKKMRISEGIVRKIIKKKLKCQSYKLGNGHFLDEKKKQAQKCTSIVGNSLFSIDFVS